MSFGKLKTRLRALINRKDFTDELAAGFITDAVADLERELRIGPMERLVEQSSWDGVKNALFIPSIYIETIRLFTNSGELDTDDMTTFLNRPDIGGVPTRVVKVADRWLLKPTPAPDTKVYLHFYAQSQPLGADTDTNVWTNSAFNATMYTAAALAADFYQMEDEYASRFSSKAAAYVEAIKLQDLDEKWSGRNAVPLPTDVGEF